MFKMTIYYAISAVNLVSGGPLAILNSVLMSLSKEQKKNIHFFVFTSRTLVIDEELQKNPVFHFIEISWACRNILTRLFFEYVYLFFWSRKRCIHLWLSLNDVTPNVVAKHRIVYFHNPSPFLLFKQMLFKKPIFVLYGWCYNLVYSINIRKNDFVVVQQNWIANIVHMRYHPKCVVTALPIQKNTNKELITEENNDDGKIRFCFPAFPRFFKNHEIIGDAVKLLNNMGYCEFIVTFTLKGGENKYSAMIKKKYGCFAQIKFVGLLNSEEMDRLYSQSDVLIFPSLLETWGLPITEFKAYGKPMLVAELEYARETVGHYQNVCFFNPLNSGQLAKLMANVIDNKITYEGSNVDEVYDCIDFDSLAERVFAL